MHLCLIKSRCYSRATRRLWLLPFEDMTSDQRPQPTMKMLVWDESNDTFTRKWKQKGGKRPPLGRLVIMVNWRRFTAGGKWKHRINMVATKNEHYTGQKAWKRWSSNSTTDNPNELAKNFIYVDWRHYSYLAMSLRRQHSHKLLTDIAFSNIFVSKTSSTRFKGNFHKQHLKAFFVWFLGKVYKSMLLLPRLLTLKCFVLPVNS